jgi:hypothetical protein
MIEIAQAPLMLYADTGRSDTKPKARCYLAHLGERRWRVVWTLAHPRQAGLVRPLKREAIDIWLCVLAPPL